MMTGKVERAKKLIRNISYAINIIITFTLAGLGAFYTFNFIAGYPLHTTLLLTTYISGSVGFMLNKMLNKELPQKISEDEK